MKGTKEIFTLLIFSIAVAFTNGCSSPIGGLLVDSLDFITVEPNRFVYSKDEYDPFKPIDHVKVYGIFGKKKDEIPIENKELKIEISEYPFTEGKNVIVLSEIDKVEGCELTPGKKNITISYRGKDAFYRISVGETKTGDGDDSGDSGITIGKDNWS